MAGIGNSQMTPSRSKHVGFGKCNCRRSLSKRFDRRSICSGERCSYRWRSTLEGKATGGLQDSAHHITPQQQRVRVICLSGEESAKPLHRVTSTTPWESSKRCGVSKKTPMKILTEVRHRKLAQIWKENQANLAPWGPKSSGGAWRKNDVWTPRLPTGACLRPRSA